MKSPALVSAAAALAVLGWLLPTLWTTQEEVPARRIVRLAEPNGASAVMNASVRSAGSAMAQFQSVIEAVTGHGRAFAGDPDAFSHLPCQEAQELAARLAGEELGQSVKDGAEFLSSLKDADYSLRAAALEAWAEHDPAGALKSLVTPPGAGISEDEDYGDDDDLVRTLVEKDPDAALRLLQSAGESSLKVGWKSVIGALAKKDAGVAFNALQTAPRVIREDALNEILSSLAEKDPRADLEWAGALPRDGKLNVRLDTVYEKWAETDPEAAITARNGANLHDGNRPGDLPEYLVRHYSDPWAERDPEGMIRWAVESGDCGKPGPWISAGIKAVAAKDPQRAAAMLEKVDAKYRTEAIDELAEAWGPTDVKSALAWSRTLNGEERTKAFTVLAPCLRQLPAAEIQAFANEAGTGTPLGFSVLWNMDQTAAAANYAAMAPGVQKELWKGLSSGTLLTAPETGFQMIRSMLSNDPPKELEDEIIPAFVAEWTRRDPAAAASAVKSLPAGNGQENAVRNLVDAWSRIAPESAAAWTRALPSGLAKDIATWILSDTAAVSGDFAGAFQWAVSSENAEMRQQVLINHYEKWLTTNPDAAKAAVEALPVEPDEKERILKSGIKPDSGTPVDPFESSEEPAPPDPFEAPEGLQPSSPSQPGAR